LIQRSWRIQLSTTIPDHNLLFTFFLGQGSTRPHHGVAQAWNGRFGCCDGVFERKGVVIERGFGHGNVFLANQALEWTARHQIGNGIIQDGHLKGAHSMLCYNRVSCTIFKKVKKPAKIIDKDSYRL
jgi:hypothetical protein